MLFGQKSLDNTSSTRIFFKKTVALTTIYLQTPWLWFADFGQRRQHSKHTFCRVAFLNENHGSGHCTRYGFSCTKQECIVKHRLRRTWMSPNCRTVSEWWCRTLINSMNVAGGVHGGLCFTGGRGEADLYDKYMAYCACQHLVTPKSRHQSSFRAGVWVLDIQRSKKQ